MRNIPEGIPQLRQTDGHFFQFSSNEAPQTPSTEGVHDGQLQGVSGSEPMKLYDRLKGQ